MCCLHVYWSFLFLRIFYNAIKTGKTEDGQRKLVVNKKEKSN